MRTKPLRLDDQPQPGLQRLVDEPPNPLRQPAIAIKPHATIVDAPASRSDAPVPASSSRLLMSEFVTSSLSPGIAAQIAAGGGRGSAAGAMLGNAQWTADGSVSQAFPPGKDGRPLEVGGQLTAAALAAAEVAASAPVAPAAPKADPTEIAALELLLADPANQELIQQFGGELKPLPTWTSVGKGIEARYGADLGGRLYQLQLAQRAVEGEFLQAMDQALKDGPPSPWSSASQKEGGVASERPGWTHGLSPGIADEHWHFDPGAFARQYVQGDTPAQRAFVSLHGTDPVQFIPASNSEAGDSNRWEVAGITLRLGLTPDAVVAKDGWAPSRLLRGEHHLDPDRITKLNNKEFVWFDPVHGFSTDPGNIKGDWLDKAMPYIFSAAITAMTFGAGSTVAAGIVSAAGGGTTGTIALGAATGAVSNAALQLAANGNINFGQLLQSALAGGATAGISKLPGVGQYLDGSASNFGQRLMEYTGRATVQGAIQAVLGGKFSDGMVNSLIGSLAGEVTGQLNAQIAEMQNLNPSEASALRLLTRAAGSALRVAGSNDPAAGFASDFLGGVMGEGLGTYKPMDAQPKPAADPLGEFIANNQQAWADRQAAYEQMLGAFNDPLAIDRSQDLLLAAGPGFAGLEGEGLGPDGAYRVTITGTGADAAREELARIDQLLQSPTGQGISRAGLYNDVVLDRFRQMSATDQRAMLAVLDNYANSLHDANALERAGLAPGSLEARRADLTMRIAADFARQSGAIPDNARFMADARAGMETGVAAMIGAVAGRSPNDAMPRKLPNGFSTSQEFSGFAARLHGGLNQAGYHDVQPILQGSAVTGVSYRTREPFDVGRISDFDVALASPSLLQRAQELGIGLREGGIRTGPLTPEDLRRLGLNSLAQTMTAQAGRDVHFMIYGSAQSAVNGKPSLPIPYR